MPSGPSASLVPVQSASAAPGQRQHSARIRQEPIRGRSSRNGTPHDLGSGLRAASGCPPIDFPRVLRRADPPKPSQHYAFADGQRTHDWSRGGALWKGPGCSCSRRSSPRVAAASATSLQQAVKMSGPEVPTSVRMPSEGVGGGSSVASLGARWVSPQARVGRGRAVRPPHRPGRRPPGEEALPATASAAPRPSLVVGGPVVVARAMAVARAGGRVRCRPPSAGRSAKSGDISGNRSFLLESVVCRGGGGRASHGLQSTVMESEPERVPIETGGGWQLVLHLHKTFVWGEIGKAILARIRYNSTLADSADSRAISANATARIAPHSKFASPCAA